MGASKNAVKKNRPPRAEVVARRLAVLGLLAWPAACTPSGWSDPTEWTGGRAAPAERVSTEQAEEPGPYPLLGNVPGEAPRPSPQYKRNQRLQALLKDRTQVRYTGQPLTAEESAARPVLVPSKPFPPGPAPVPPPRPTAPGRDAPAARPSTDAMSAPAAAPMPLRPGTATPGPGTPAASGSAAETAAPRSPQQSAAPRDRATERTLVGVIQFLDGSVTVDAKDKRILREIARLQRQHGGRIRVVGHSSGRLKSRDPARHRLANFELSLGRARNVALAMMELGVDPETLQVVAASASEPAYRETLPTGEAGNRRVEIFLEY